MKYLLFVGVLDYIAFWRVPNGINPRGGYSVVSYSPVHMTHLYQRIKIKRLPAGNDIEK